MPQDTYFFAGTSASAAPPEPCRRIAAVGIRAISFAQLRIVSFLSAT